MGLTDKVKDVLSGSGVQGGSTTGAGQASSGAGPAPGGAVGAGGSSGQQDYGDKALDFLEQRSGHNLGAGTNEKITDGARGMYEKATGQKVNPKISN
ncbi:hypothetical protein OIDMADRAFT_19122 [Oidiodendron maius Zn]|uniref:Uncharacterized protein n=1 Tax=Oidiodendron maius (strain Zn) TaxID=913774 RepID=A0A0C3CQ14_OIDMZ|nr:hypothetical protein OIDMADRAFT_19122 [Oidiodendron maius Zn]